MSIKQEFLDTLTAGRGHRAVLELVASRKISPQEAYDALQEIWVEMNYDDNEGEDALRNELEFVMERLWFQRPANG